MYSRNWFDSFAATVPDSLRQIELDGITAVCPPDRYSRLLELGCGTGRVAGPLARLGYQVVGLDIQPEALQIARRQAPGPAYIALDQRHVGRMDWQFDAALVLWNSLGFDDRAGDLEMLAGLARVLRPGGKLVLDLYHPGWLGLNQQSGRIDPRGVVVDRWLKDGRSLHVIRYPDGTIDRIGFNVYYPDEMQALLSRAGLTALVEMAWWDPERKPKEEFARYQVVAVKPPHQKAG